MSRGDGVEGMKHRTMTPQEIRTVIEEQQRLMEQQIRSKDWRGACDTQVCIHTLKVVLGEYDSEGNVKE